MVSANYCNCYYLHLLLLLSLRKIGVLGCGGLFCEPNQPVVQAGEAIAFGVDGRNLEMHVQILYEGPAEEFSWLLPIPYEPEIGVGSELLFVNLFQQTLPQYSFTVSEDPETCSNKSPVPCPVMADSAARGDVAEEAEDEAGAIVLQSGSVGPYDFVVIEASDNNPDSVRVWLAENGYDEYVGSAALLNYYAVMGYKFVALRLRKEVDAGDIQPLILKQEMPEGTDPFASAIACVPIKLTAVAANNDMPVQVYVLGEHRATPVNYLEMILDETQVNWIGCQNNQFCYISDLRNRFAMGAELTDQLVFLTEYAGSSDVMANQIRLDDIDIDSLAASKNPLNFLQAMSDANIPSFALLDTIIDKYIPKSAATVLWCQNFPSLYLPQQPWNMDTCVNSLLLTSPFDAAGLASELNERVLEPAADAQTFVDSYSYLTRLYAELSPENMIKDPFFAFNQISQDVSNIHTATGLVKCSDNASINPSIMDITVENNGDNGISSVVSHEVTQDCFSWGRVSFDPLYGPDNSPVLKYVTSDFAGDNGQSILRSKDGTFAASEVRDLMDSIDSRVMSQVVPEYDENQSLPPVDGQPSSQPPVDGQPSSSSQPPVNSGPPQTTMPPVVDTNSSTTSSASRAHLTMTATGMYLSVGILVVSGCLMMALLPF